MTPAETSGRGKMSDLAMAIWASLRDERNDGLADRGLGKDEENDDIESFESLLRAHTDQSQLEISLIG